MVLDGVVMNHLNINRGVIQGNVLDHIYYFLS